MPNCFSLLIEIYPSGTCYFIIYSELSLVANFDNSDLITILYSGTEVGVLPVTFNSHSSHLHLGKARA